MTQASELLMNRIAEGRQFRRNDMHPEFRIGSGEEDEGALIVEGHFTTFNEEYLLYRSNYYEVYEQIDAHAFDECDMSDVIMQYDHEGRVYAKNRNNTLQISFDNIGGFMRADLSKASDGKGLYNDIKNGLVDRMSFGFTVKKDKRLEEYDSTRDVWIMHRCITKIRKLYDVSAVSIPANDGTDISARNFCDGAIAELEAERLKAQMSIEARRRLALKLRLMEEK